jgi:hypothetical protein
LLSSFLMQKKSAKIFCGNSEKITSSSDHFVRRKKASRKVKSRKLRSSQSKRAGHRIGSSQAHPSPRLFYLGEFSSGAGHPIPHRPS